MKLKEKFLLLINIFIPILIIFETLFSKNVITKVTILFATILFILLIINKQIEKKEQKYFILLIGYIIMYIFINISKYDVIFTIKNLLIITKIFSFPIIIYSVINLFKKTTIKNKKKILLISNLILTAVLLIVTLIKSSSDLISIVIANLFSMYIFLDDTKKQNIIKLIIMTLILLISLIFRNYLAFIFALILYINNIKNSRKKRIKLIILILCIISLCCLIYKDNSSLSNTHHYTVINPEYEVLNNDHAINNWYDTLKIFKYNEITEILFGLNYYSIGFENISICYSFLTLGILGFILYIIIWKIIIEKLDKKKDLEIISILLFGFVTNLFLNPIFAYSFSLIFINKITKNINKKQDYTYTKKTIIYAILVIIVTFIMGISFYYINKKDNLNNLNLESITIEIENGLKINNGYKLKEINKNTKEDGKIKENLYYYEIERSNNIIAEILYIKRSILDATIEFITINNKENPISINLKISDNQLEEILNFEKYNIEFEYSNLVGINKLKLPIGYFKDTNKYMIIGRSVDYNILTSNYNEYNKSIVYNMNEQYDDLNKNYKNIKILPNNSVDTYIIKSNKELFENENSIKGFIETLNNNSSWMRYNGNLYKLQYSIDPFTREGYGKILGRLIEKDIYIKVTTDRSLIYSLLSENAIYSLYNYTPKLLDNGVWLTEYTSTWLSKDYGTKAYYVDTRYNETIGYLLLKKYNETKDEKFKESFLAYADFIIEEWKGNNTYTIDNNKLLSDYFSDTNTRNPHSSLNHQLALVNYLFKAYEETKERDYLITAEDILKNLLKFDKLWIRENGDLWYQINDKGEFSGTDCEIVTLEDLVITQDYLDKIKGEQNEIITNLIISKIKYLNNSGIAVSQFALKKLEKLAIDIPVEKEK